MTLSTGLVETGIALPPTVSLLVLGVFPSVPQAPNARLHLLPKAGAQRTL